MNKEDMIFLADILVNECDSFESHKYGERFQKLIEKVNLIVQQIHMQDNIMEIQNKLAELEKTDKTEN